MIDRKKAAHRFRQIMVEVRDLENERRREYPPCGWDEPYRRRIALLQREADDLVYDRASLRRRRGYYERFECYRARMKIMHEAGLSKCA